LNEEIIAYFTPRGEQKGTIPLQYINEIKEYSTKSRPNMFVLMVDCTYDKKRKQDAIELPIDCVDPYVKQRWFKYIDTIIKVYKLEKNTSMFGAYQSSLTERLILLMRACGAFYTNNSEFLKRLVNQGSRTEWNEAVGPMLESVFNVMNEVNGCARDGNIRSAEITNEALKPLEKIISNAIGRWGRLNDKGHGPEVDKMQSNLEGIESCVHRIENVLVDFISKVKEEAENKRVMEEKQKEADAKKQVQLQELRKQQIEEQKKYAEQVALQNKEPEYDPNISDIDKKILSLSHKYKKQNIDEEDPNAKIMNMLAGLTDLN